MNSLIRLARLFANHPLTRNAPLTAWGDFLRGKLEADYRARLSSRGSADSVSQFEMA